MDKYGYISIYKLAVGELETNCYIVANEKAKGVTIIDPGAEANKILEHLGNKEIDSVILTHGHFDHISAIDILAKNYDFKLYIHQEDAEMLNDPMKNLSDQFLPEKLIIQHDYISYIDNEIIISSGLEFKALHTPGHSKGSSCLLINVDGENILFTGDTLFAGGYGRTDLYGGDFSTIVNSMRRLYKLKDYYYCYPGHGGNTILGKKES